jgi:hypothetical protein
VNRTEVERTASGRFRICPVCQRNVPPGVVECRCGVDVPEIAPASPGASARNIPLSHAAWAVAVVVAFFAGREVGRFNAPVRPVETAVVPSPPPALTAAPAPAPQVTAWAVDPGPPVTTVPTAAPPAPRIEIALPASPRPREDADPSPPPDPSKTEAHWRGRLGESRDTIRAAYQTCLAEWERSGVARQDVGMAWTEMPAVADLDGARAGILTALMAQAQLEESARRAGVPAGWVRFDWSDYPKLAAPGGAGHPCSVPDLLHAIGY